MLVFALHTNYCTCWTVSCPNIFLILVIASPTSNYMLTLAYKYGINIHFHYPGRISINTWGALHVTA